MGLQRGEGVRVAEKAGDADQQVAKEGIQFRGRFLHEAEVVVRTVDLLQRHPSLDPADQRVLLVLGEIVAGLGAQQDTDLLQRLLGLGGRGGDRVRFLAKGVGHIGEELGGHLGWRQHVVDLPSGNGAARHAVELGAFGGLGHGHAPLAFDGAHPLRAVAAGAREHDADGPLPLVLGQGAKEEVDGQPQAPRRTWLQQLQRAVKKGHVPIGGDDVRTVGLDAHPVFDLEDFHAGVALDQFAEDALVIRRKVLHQYEGHAALAVAGMAEKKASKAASPPADAPMPTMGKLVAVRCFGIEAGAGSAPGSGASISSVSATGGARAVGGCCSLLGLCLRAIVCLLW